jgi:hypothetical protein
MHPVLNRFYADFLLPSKRKVYENLLKTASAQDYQTIGISDFFSGKHHNEQGRLLILRHDIDTDPESARIFHLTEQKLNMGASYYFRLSTLNVPLMREIHNSGSEVGYHYEELSDYCKKYRIKDPEKAIREFSNIRSFFLENLAMVEKKIGFKITSAASHGDFVNRYLKLPNHSFVTDELLKEAGLVCECYNPSLLEKYSFIASDAQYPKIYRPESPEFALKNKLPVVYLLTHPRHWFPAPLSNLKDNLKRMLAGIQYNF